MKHKSKRILFFATYNDIEKILLKVEEMHSIKYYLAGLFDDNKPNVFSTFKEMRNLGYTNVNDWNQDYRYVILPKENILKIREVLQYNNGIKFAVDLLENQIGVVVQFGGIHKNNIMIAGSFGVISESKFCAKIMALIKKEVFTKFQRVGGFFVGAEAEKLLNSGWRLVINTQSPTQYDLIPKIKIKS